MVDDYQVQTAAQVSVINNRKMIKQISKEITNNDNTNIEKKIDNLINTLNTDTSGVVSLNNNNIDLSTITNKIDDLDTELIKTQNKDMLIRIKEQEKSIENLERKIDLILEKL